MTGLRAETRVGVTLSQLLFQEVDVHPSVARMRAEESGPITLQDCLHDFIKAEKLTGDDLYYCSKCQVLL